MPKLVTCQNHPGKHLQTHRCESPKPQSAGSKISDWLERKLNPKQGRPYPVICAACANAFIESGPEGLCIYCGSEEFQAANAQES